MSGSGECTRESITSTLDMGPQQLDAPGRLAGLPHGLEFAVLEDGLIATVSERELESEQSVTLLMQAADHLDGARPPCRRIKREVKLEVDLTEDGAFPLGNGGLEREPGSSGGGETGGGDRADGAGEDVALNERSEAEELGHVCGR